MTAPTYDITIDQGSTWSLTMVLKSNGTPIPLTGYTGRMHVRQRVNDATPLVELTIANGRLTITEAEGRVTLAFTAAETAAFTWRKGFYDLEIVDTLTQVTKLLRGTVSVIGEITR